MPQLTAFHEVSFPLAVALGATGGPERLTEIVTLGSGREVRNARWADSRRRYDAGSGVKSLADLHAVIAFFEERRGRLTGFRFRDRADDRSCAPGLEPQPGDQPIGTGDGATAVFQLAKTYGAAFAPFVRTIRKPVAGSVRVAVGGAELGDARCKLPLGPLEAPATVVEAEDASRLRVSGVGGQPAGWYTHGLLAVVDGPLAGSSARIDTHLKSAGATTLVLRRPLAAVPAAGTALTLTAGCDKSFRTCHEVFANSVNFRGFPHIPGRDAAFAYAREGGRHDGGSLVS